MSSVRSVVRMVSTEFKIPQSLIVSEARESQAVAQARQVAIFVHHYRNLRNGGTQRATALAFDRKPPTVNHAINAVKTRMKKNRAFKQQVMSIADR